MLQLEYIPFGKAGSPAGPWLNLRLGVQYTLFSRLNGGDTNYDGFGHSAQRQQRLVRLRLDRHLRRQPRDADARQGSLAPDLPGQLKP